jgi:serine/threonine-protein kinase HipA
MRRIEVHLDFGLDDTGHPLSRRHVGTLAEDDRRIAFEYAPAFLAAPLPISPWHLAPRIGLFFHDDPDFDRLPGAFADALPDGFGRLVQDRAFEAQGIPRVRITPLDRLAALGDAAMGALTFQPGQPLVTADRDAAAWPLDLAALAAQGERLLEGSAEEVLPQLTQAGGSPGGARPKILAGLGADGRLITGATPGMVTGRAPTLPDGYAPWIIKFAAREDVAAFGPDVGAVELAYALLARAAGIDVVDSRLFVASDGQRWFGAARFDRHGPGGRGRHHVHTVGGLLHASHRRPSLDYDGLLQATGALTRDMREVAEAVRRMAFNVFAHNRDDHARNVAFRMTTDGRWRLAPAYDLTFSGGISGHHSMSVGGETLAPTVATMRRLARDAGLDASRIDALLDEVDAAVATWPAVAAELDISRTVTRRVSHVLDATRRSARAARSTPGRRHR